MSLSEPLRKQISELVAQNRVVLFMKGTRRMPQCGFSAQVVKILDALLRRLRKLSQMRVELRCISRSTPGFSTISIHAAVPRY